MRTADFYYDLPQELIAQDPLEDRSSSRLMHLDKETGELEHTDFKHILNYLKPGDCLVVNDTKVIPARLYGHKKETGAVIEILLLKRRENDIWECLVKPGKKARPGAVIDFGEGLLTGEIIDVVDEGNRLIQFIMKESLRRFWISWGRCRCRRISHISYRIRTVIRPYMQNTKDLRPHPLPDCILHRNFWIR